MVEANNPFFPPLGTVNDIELELVYPDSATRYFDLDGKSLRLIQPLDRDKDDLSSLQLSVRLMKNNESN